MRCAHWCGTLLVIAMLGLPSMALAVEPAGTGPADAAETTPATGGDAGAEEASWQERGRAFVEEDLLPVGKTVLLALLLFLAGWLIAKLIAWTIYRGLLKTSLDDRVAERLGIKVLFEGDRRIDNRVERLTARIVYYLLMLLVVVAVMQYAGLTQAATPIQTFVDRVVAALPLIGKAVLILAIAYFAGIILQRLVTRGLNQLRLDARFAELSQPAAPATEPAATRTAAARKPAAGKKPAAEAEAEAAAVPAERAFSENAGRVVFWLIMVIGLAGAADALAIGPLAHAMRNVVDRMVGLLPSIAIAVALFIAGWLLGRIACTVLDNVLDAAGFNKLVARLQLDKLFGERRASWVIGIAAMAFIVLQATIAALDEVGLQTLSVPLTDMMVRFWYFLPVVAVSLLIVIAGVIAGRLLRQLVEGALRNMDFDGLMAKLGFGDLARGAAAEAEVDAQTAGRVTKPHQLVGLITQVGVILIAVVQALDNLELDTWSAYVNGFIEFSVTRVLVALVIVAVGLALGNYVRDLIMSRRRDEGDDAIRWIAMFARYAVLVFAFTMAIHHLDVGPNFVLISFSLLFGSLCLALALALGLGGREVAGDFIKRQYDRARQEVRARSKPAGGSAPARPGPGKGEE